MSGARGACAHARVREREDNQDKQTNKRRAEGGAGACTAPARPPKRARVEGGAGQRAPAEEPARAAPLRDWSGYYIS